MSSRNAWLDRSVLAALALALFSAGCHCTKHAAPHLEPKVPATGGDHGPPKVYGRARFDGSSVRLDLKVTQGDPYTAGELVASYASHGDAEVPVYTADPNNPYVHTPSDGWI